MRTQSRLGNTYLKESEMRSKWILPVVVGLIVIALSLAAVSSKTDQLGVLLNKNMRDITRGVQSAAHAGHVNLDARTIVEAQANGARLVVGAIKQPRVTAVADFTKGVDVAFGYFGFPQGAKGVQPPVVPGFYTVRITTADLKLPNDRPEPLSGTNARATLIDRTGRVVAALPATVTHEPFDGALPHAVLEPTIEPQSTVLCMWLGGGSTKVCWGARWLDYFTFV